MIKVVALVSLFNDIRSVIDSFLYIDTHIHSLRINAGRFEKKIVRRSLAARRRGRTGSVLFY